MAGKGNPRTGGRAPGTPNKVTTGLREMTQEALNRLGGTDYLVYLGKDQPAVFGALLRRCMPQAVETQSDDDVPVVTLNFAGDHKANVAKRVRKALEPAMINELSDDQLRTLYLEDELASRTGIESRND